MGSFSAGGSPDAPTVAEITTGLVAAGAGGRLVFASAVQATVVVNATAGNVSLPDVVVVLPSGITIDRVIAAVSWRKQVESSTSANAVNVAQQIQVRDDTPGTFRNAITIADNSLATAASATEGGQTLLGDSDISAEVDGDDTYNFQWTSADVDGASLTFHDWQCFLIIEYSS